MSAGRAHWCGELHYPRIPREYWEARLAMAREMGLDSVSTYVFWNVHEPSPGAYDFGAGNDVAEFVRAAARQRLAVVLRPGPYVCAEWDYGGLPAWLLAGDPIPVRTADERWMAPVRRWLQRLGKELAPHQRTHGGPIVAVQLENEYGAFGSDPEYLRALRAALIDAGFNNSPFFTIDQPGDLERGSLPDVRVAATFAPGDPERDLSLLIKLRSGQDPAVGEYWAGWFDHWGEPHVRVDDAAQERDVAWMRDNRVGLNFYMFHGGTNFGFYNGANAGPDKPYAPTTTSYDYQAALDEAGRPTEKWYAFRKILRPSVLDQPPVPRTQSIAAFDLDEYAGFDQLLHDSTALERPIPMEALGQSFGFTLYRTIASAAAAGTLDIGEARDFAVVMVDGAVRGTLDRRLGQHALPVELARGATLDILVENCGRINYGPDFANDRKGLLGRVTLGGAELQGWQAYRLPLDDLGALRFGARPFAAPAFLRGTFACDDPADTFLDVRDLGKGVLFVNGRNAGRYWNVGPQGALYVPGVWLRRGKNEVVAFQTVDGAGRRICGSEEPIVVPISI